MNALSRRSVQVLDVLREIYAQQDPDAFASHVVHCMPRLIATDVASFNEIDPCTGKGRTVVAPAGADRFPGSEEIFERFVTTHPYVVHVERFADGNAYRVSDFMMPAEFRRLPIYNEYYRRIGTNHQLAVTLPSAPSQVRGIALSRRGRDYSEDERRLLTTVAPHLVQAYANAQALARARGTAPPANGARGDRANDDNAVEIVLLSATGRIQFATPRARRWLACYLGGSPARDARLPHRLVEWLACDRVSRNGEAAPPPRPPLLVARDGGRLEIRVMAEWDRRALLLHERRMPAAPTRAPLGLSPREAQVLTWVAEGKTNSEIGMILGARPRTVAKHLERIFRKLGVETRTAAAALVLAGSSP